MPVAGARACGCRHRLPATHGRDGVVVGRGTDAAQVVGMAVWLQVQQRVQGVEQVEVASHATRRQASPAQRVGTAQVAVRVAV